jgi:DNA mismatch endonuclease, patch repair protein
MYNHIKPSVLKNYCCNPYILRKELWKRGLRYRKNVKDIFGKPDIVFKSKKLVVFADSEFWHGKQLLEGKYIPKTNTKFWVFMNFKQ